MFTNFPLFNHLKKGMSIQLSTTHLFNYLKKGMFIQLSTIHLFHYLKKGMFIQLSTIHLLNHLKNMFIQFPLFILLFLFSPKNRFWDGWPTIANNGQNIVLFWTCFFQKIIFSGKKGIYVPQRYHFFH